MTHYFELQVLPNADVTIASIMNMAFGKLHLALARLNSDDIGVSFPRAKKTPGDMIRIHGRQEALNSLKEMNAWNGMLDFVQISAVAPVPEVDAYVQVNRVQPKFSAAKLRRAVRRGSMTEADAEALFQRQQDLKHSFLSLASGSTGQKYPLFFEQRTIPETEGLGTFNTFGFTSTGGVPMF